MILENKQNKMIQVGLISVSFFFFFKQTLKLTLVMDGIDQLHACGMGLEALFGIVVM